MAIDIPEQGLYVGILDDRPGLYIGLEQLEFTQPDGAKPWKIERFEEQDPFINELYLHMAEESNTLPALLFIDGNLAEGQPHGLETITRARLEVGYQGPIVFCTSDTIKQVARKHPDLLREQVAKKDPDVFYVHKGMDFRSVAIEIVVDLANEDPFDPERVKPLHEAAEHLVQAPPEGGRVSSVSKVMAWIKDFLSEYKGESAGRG